MDRLSIFLTLPVGAVLVGTFAIAALTLNFYGWPAMIGALVVGSLLAWPIAYLISRRIKREDRDWSGDRADTSDRSASGSKTPEV